MIKIGDQILVYSIFYFKIKDFHKDRNIYHQTTCIICLLNDNYHYSFFAEKKNIHYKVC